MNKYALMALLISIHSVNTYSQELMLPSFKSHKIKDMELLHTGDDFVSHNTKTHERKQIKPYDVSKELRSLKKEDLAKLLKHATLHMKKIGTDDYKVEFNVRAPGGGHYTGLAFAYVTRAFLWAIPIYGIKKTLQSSLASESSTNYPIVKKAVDTFVDKGMEPITSLTPESANMIGKELASRVVDSQPNGAQEVVIGTIAAGTSTGNPQAAFSYYGQGIEILAQIAYQAGMAITFLP